MAGKCVRERERIRACVRAASIVFQVCLASRRQWVSHCEEVEPSHFLLLEQQQPVLRAPSPALLKYVMLSGSLGFYLLCFFFLSPRVAHDKDRIRLFSGG